ncbi:arsenate reductase (glutaredoxin) [Persicimonas caeni]|uniref:Arsenate reductase (Glutaredoxin) n=1 Tax=Persicimonas caeni TaxID=2292766 RepID=A0A4Y6PQD6_PERCE|nr:arsenate reductase (glutaredoxin) [Persicimonas caeni]QDG50319.1 arsenate reductase (glutaredoxin) [Persicimonas caeni]QED31540.1 arsenate reductase (glutaredoxin) [Persicimonas caeni]
MGTKNVEIWHYPRCSKSRKTLALLEERGIEPEVRKYRQDPPDADTLGDVLDKLGMSPRELMRKKEDEYKELGLDDESLSRDELIEAMVDNPILIERPVVIAGDKAALGRPPENVLSLFEEA